MRRAHRLVVVFLATAICGTLTAAVATVAGHRGPPRQVAVPGAPLRGLASLASVPAAPGDRLLAVATLGRGRRSAGPAPGALTALESLGLRALPLRNLPLALVSGTRDDLESAVRGGVAADVYPDERLRFFSDESTAAIRADAVRGAGVTGRGVGVAIVDSGVDATHPDLADHVTHNFKVVGSEYLDVLGGPKRRPQDPPGTLVIPVDGSSYPNADTSSGHGTHVAGIVAADGHTSPSQVGVAPDASLVGYGTGEAISIFTILAAFDHLLEHHREWGVRVVNNSWGTSARPFDPAHPVNVATRALHDAGLVVVFAAGNDGQEGTINPYSVAPWVISVGAASLTKERASFTSGGFEHDNSEPAGIPEDRHQRFDGERIGIYHPDVSAPGTDIVSSGTPTGVGVLAPSAPGGTVTLSGTSMATPHVAGLAALLLQARPSLTPDQVRQVLQASAAPMAGDAAFWQNGYGFGDAQAALALVRRGDFGQAVLDRLQAAADAKVLAARSSSVRSLDLWSFEPAPVSTAGSDTRVFETAVPADTRALKAVVSYPSLALVGANPFDWEITVKDADGRVVARSTPSADAGVSSLFVDLAGVDGGVAHGTWRFEVSGLLGAADTDAFLGNVVTLAVAQLQPRTAVRSAPSFVAGAGRTLYFQPSNAAGVLPVPIVTPEGCTFEPGAPKGRLGETRATDGCVTGLVGFATTHAGEDPVEFSTTAPLSEPVVLGGRSSFTLWLADPAAPVWTLGFASAVTYTLDAVLPGGRTVPVAAGDLERKADGPEEVDVTPVRAEYPFDVPPTTVPAGSVLRVRLRLSGAYTSAMRLFFGGPYADAGLTVGTGRYTG